LSTLTGKEFSGRRLVRLAWLRSGGVRPILSFYRSWYLTTSVPLRKTPTGGESLEQDAMFRLAFLMIHLDSGQ
jgi:hypothetical protein